MVRGEYGSGASIDVFRKDLGIIRSFLADTGSYAPLLEVVASLYEQAAEEGLGGADPAAVHAIYTTCGREDPK
jgi:3-hydroxyisobutyrate dehydrogenase-like beta-hydroxyacid dehydrogenase